MSTEDRVKRVISELFGIPVGTLKSEHTFVGDWGADSLDGVELLMALENEFEMTLPEDGVDEIETIQDLISFMRKQLGEQVLEDEVMEMPLCDSVRVVLRIGQLYRFAPVDGCKKCEEMKLQHDLAYGGDGNV